MALNGNPWRKFAGKDIFSFARNFEVV